MYSYLPAGAVTAKNVSLTRAPGYPYQAYSPASLEVDYTYDSAGRTSTVTYPMTFQNSYNTQPVMTMGYDGMGRPVSMTDPSGDPGTSGSYPPTNWVSGVQYDYAGRQTNMSWLTGLATGYNSTSESRTWNVNGQLASIGWSGYITPGVGQIQYNYSTTQNNGQITQEVDSYPYGVGVTTTSYQYDPLKRLTSATAQSTGSAPSPYAQTFQYDGFGNLTAKVLNETSTPIAVNGTTNQLANAYYDLNGNMLSGRGGYVHAVRRGEPGCDGDGDVGRRGFLRLRRVEQADLPAGQRAGRRDVHVLRREGRESGQSIRLAPAATRMVLVLRRR